MIHVFAETILDKMVLNGVAVLWNMGRRGRENANSTSTETGQYATGFGLYKFYKEGKGSLANTI